jgi:small subunit ribosomal protein S1
LSDIKNPSVIELSDIDDAQLNELIDNTISDFDEGDLVTGVVVKIEHDEVLLDIGFKSEGVIPSRELSIRKDADPSEIVSVDEKIEALVLQKEDKDGRLILSKKRAEYERAWIDIEQKFNEGENVIGEVIEVVKGGLILDIGLRGFLPASLVDLRRVKDLESFTGEQIEARVIEMDRNRNNVVLSRRVVLEEGRKNERSEILEKLTKGMRLKGAVSSIVEFGAFVDLGGIDGLVHISELSWNHVTHPSEVVKVGDEVEVEVLDVDMRRERISLGLKQTTEDPWRQLVKNYPVGAILEGKVTKLLTFGAFVGLGDTVEGLVHISEMAARHIIAPAQVVHVGDEVHVKVIDIDEERRRISLSMKAAAETLGIEIEIAEPDPSMLKPKDGRTRRGESVEEAFEEGEAAIAAEAGESLEAVEASEDTPVDEAAAELSEDAAEVVEDAVDSAEEVVEEAAEATEEVVDAAAETVEEVAEAAVETVEETVEAVVEETTEVVEDAVEDAVEAAAEITEEVAEVIEEAAEVVDEAAEEK